jgi:hypothetical protein
MRLDYTSIAPEATKALAGVNAALLRAGLDWERRWGMDNIGILPE